MGITDPINWSCTRNMGVTSLHHSPATIRSFIFAPYNRGRDKSPISLFLTGAAASNRHTPTFMDANMLLERHTHNKKEKVFLSIYKTHLRRTRGDCRVLTQHRSSMDLLHHYYFRYQTFSICLLLSSLLV